MSAPDRRAMVERPGNDLSVRRQCALVGCALGGLPPQARHRGGRSGGDAPHRRAASRTSASYGLAAHVALLNAPSSWTRRAVGRQPPAVQRLHAGLTWGSRRWFRALGTSQSRAPGTR